MQASVERGLLVTTDNEEVTVGFDFYHSHFDSVVGEGEHFGTATALEFVRQIVSQRVAVASWWLDDEWKASGQLAAGTQPKASFAIQHGISASGFGHGRAASMPIFVFEEAVCQPPNKQSQRTVMDEVPSHIGQRAADELRR